MKKILAHGMPVFVCNLCFSLKYRVQVFLSLFYFVYIFKAQFFCKILYFVLIFKNVDFSNCMSNILGACVLLHPEGSADPKQ